MGQPWVRANPSSAASVPCESRYLTARSDLPTLAPQVAAVLAELGVPALPWAAQALDVLMEYEPTKAGPRFRFREATITTPRQCMKSSLCLGLAVHRALVLTDLEQHVAYTAQSGHDARRKLRDEFLPRLLNSSLEQFVTKVRRASGHEAVYFGQSRIEPVSSNVEAGHGRIIDLAIIDEAFADTDDRREQSLSPATLTRGPHTGGTPQFLVASTAGTDASTYLRRKVDVGRESVISGVDDGSFYCEYSIPDDADLDDEEVWWRHHPGLGYLIDIDAIRQLRRTMTDSDFRRAVGNQWTKNTDTQIPVILWLARKDPTAAPAKPNLWFSVDVNPERTYTSVCAADESGQLEMIAREPGLAWFPDWIKERLRRNVGSKLAIDGTGPAATLISDLERRIGTRKLHVLTSREMAMASATFLDGVVEGWLRVRPHDLLDLAVLGAKKRMRTDSFTWARKSTTTDLAPLVAASEAVWAARTIKLPKPNIT